MAIRRSRRRRRAVVAAGCSLVILFVGLLAGDGPGPRVVALIGWCGVWTFGRMGLAPGPGADLSRRDARTVRKSVSAGRAPSDPRLRDAALEAARRSQRELSPDLGRRLTIVLLALSVAGLGVAIAAANVEGIIGAGFSAAVWTSTLIAWARLSRGVERRVAMARQAEARMVQPCDEPQSG